MGEDGCHLNPRQNQLNISDATRLNEGPLTLIQTKPAVASAEHESGPK
jgi:hypothetical protein